MNRLSSVAKRIAAFALRRLRFERDSARTRSAAAAAAAPTAAPTVAALPVSHRDEVVNQIGWGIVRCRMRLVAAKQIIVHDMNSAHILCFALLDDFRRKVIDHLCT